MSTGRTGSSCARKSPATLHYTYHPDGSVETMTDGRGRVLSYGYDRRGSGSISMILKTVRSVSFPAGRRSRRNGMTGKGCVSA